MTSRICLILTCLIAFSGCYTQLRAPRVQQEQRAESPASPTEDSVQRFEYYYYNYCNPSPLRFYEPYRPYRPHRPYRLYSRWNRHRLVWEYSYWASVYDPWWRGWSPRILVPHIVYTPVVRIRPQIEREQVNPRPRIRYTGVRGEPASASAIRSGRHHNRKHAHSTAGELAQHQNGKHSANGKLAQHQNTIIREKRRKV